MGHDIHFLERLERVNADQQALALRLYRDPQTTRKIIEHRGTSLSEQAERIAIALDDGGDGPHVIVARSGRFVTCLARGMKLSDGMPVISRALLEEDEQWRRKMAAREDDGGSIIAALVEGISVGRWPSRAEVEEVELFSSLYIWDLTDIIKTSFDAFAEVRQIISAGRGTRRRFEAKKIGRDESTIVLLGDQRRLILHLGVIYAMGVRSGPPLERLSFEAEWLPGLALRLGELRSPAAVLRAAWLLSSREEIGGEPLMYEMYVQTDGGAQGIAILVYTLATLGRLMRASREEREVLIASFEHHAAEIERDHGVGVAPLAQHMRRTLWCWEHRDLSLPQRAVLLAQQPSTDIPDWATRFYDPVWLEREPEGATQALLACEDMIITRQPEGALLWLYMPEIARRSPPLLYPIKPPPPVSRKALEAIDRAYIERTTQLEHQRRVVVSQKQGRNDPCACGSGKKYKKCCGVNQDDQEV